MLKLLVVYDSFEETKYRIFENKIITKIYHAVQDRDTNILA